MSENKWVLVVLPEESSKKKKLKSSATSEKYTDDMKWRGFLSLTIFGLIYLGKVIYPVTIYFQFR